jgi:hypothetical protein
MLVTQNLAILRMDFSTEDSGSLTPKDPWVFGYKPLKTTPSKKDL